MPDGFDALNSDTSEAHSSFIIAVVDRICPLSKKNFEFNLVHRTLLSDILTALNYIEDIRKLPIGKRETIIFTLSSLIQFLNQDISIILPNQELLDKDLLLEKLDEIIRLLIDEDIEISLMIPRNLKGPGRRASYDPKKT